MARHPQRHTKKHHSQHHSQRRSPLTQRADEGAQPQPEDTELSLDERRAQVADKLEAYVFETVLRDCPRMLCHRKRSCRPPRGGLCASPRGQQPDLSKEEMDERIALLVHEVKRRLAEFAAARAAVSAARDTKPSDLPSRRRGGSP